MALKILMLRKRLTDEEKNNAALRAKLVPFAQREQELAQSIEAASTEEERNAVQAAVEAFENERDAAQQAVTASDALISELRGKIEAAEREQQAAVQAGGEGRGTNPSRQGGGMTLREAEEFQRSHRHVYRDVRSLLRATPLLTSSTGVVGPTGVGGINDGFVGVSSLVDLLKVTDCTGMASYKVAYLAGDAADAAAVTEGSVPTESEPTFGSVELTPTTYGTIAYVSDGIADQTPLTYEAKVRESARRSLRRSLNKVAATAILASSLNDSFALSAAASATTGAAFFDGALLSNIILGYGGEEDTGGVGVLFLTKADLKAFAAVRGKNEYLPVYSIVPDAANPSTGIIKDNNGLSCRYCLSKDVKSLSTLTLTTTATKTMFYGVPSNAELALWGGFDIRVDPSYKFGEGLLSIRGRVTADVDVTVKSGFTVVTAKKAAG